MLHDPALTDRLGNLPVEAFKGEVFRATGLTAHPVAASSNGGRWAPGPGSGLNISVLYTSLEREGAIAEVSSYLAELHPVPTKPLRIHRLAVTTSRSLRLLRADLAGLGVDLGRYGERDYARTQEIGAVLNFLGFDGLIAPFARWPCDNPMIFTDNHAASERLEPLDASDVDWRAWARSKGLL